MARILVCERVNLRRSGVHLERTCDMLTRAQHSIVECRDGLEVLSWLIDKAHPVDLVITGIFMPVMDGLELIQSLRRRGLRMPILALYDHASSLPAGLISSAASAFGATSVQPRPFAGAKLIEIVAGLLAG